MLYDGSKTDVKFITDKSVLNSSESKNKINGFGNVVSVRHLASFVCTVLYSPNAWTGFNLICYVGISWPSLWTLFLHLFDNSKLGDSCNIKKEITKLPFYQKRL